MATILDWIAMGRPTMKVWSGSGYTYSLPQSANKTPWVCNSIDEGSVSPSDREAWFAVKPGCRGNYDATVGGGLLYSPSQHVFLGEGASATDAKKITYTPPPAPSIAASPTTSVPGISASSGANSGLPAQAISTSGATPMVTTTTTAGSLSSVLGAGVGTLIGGPAGGYIGGTLTGLLSGIGKSKCPGPYNYNPTTGGCDPKPSTLAGGTATAGVGSCPSGYVYDPSTLQCKKTGLAGTVERVLPGGKTGYTEPLAGWTSTEAYGTTGFIPQAVSSSYLTCPRGFVLYGKQAGMEVCLPKGMLPNKYRKWPKSPNPALSAQDMKTLRRIGTLQKRIRRVAGNAGFTVKKR